MTYDEFKTKLTKIVSDADTALANLPGFLDEVKADYETLSSSVSKVTEQEGRIRDLQDTNMKLFLAQTGQPVETPDEPERTGQDAVDDFVNMMMTDDGK